MKSWYLKYRQENNAWFLKANLSNLISFLSTVGEDFNKNVREHDAYFFDKNSENSKLLVFNRLLETRAPSIIVRSPVILLWKQVLKLLIVWFLLVTVKGN